MEMPRPGAEHERLARLAGDWGGEEKMYPSPFNAAGGNAMGRFRARMGLDGFYLLADYEQDVGGAVMFRGHGVFGWDPKDGSYTMHWFDSSGLGQPHPARGLWDGDTLRLTYDSVEQGASRYLYLLGEDHLRLRIETSADGHTWTPFLDGKYRRR